MDATTTQPSRDEMLARAQAMIPAIRERAAAAEKAGCIPEETIAELHASGLWRINQPARVGGGEYDYLLLVEVAHELARGDASTGWVFVNLAVHHWMLAMWPPQGQNTVWDEDPDALIASSVIYPAGKATKVEGGYRLTGHWPFCSGILHSGWIMLGAMAEGAGPDGGPEPRIFLVATKDLTIFDQWDVMGLRATGSVDSECADLFVPDYMTIAGNATRGDLHPGSAANPQPVFRQSVGGLFPHLISTVLLGVARGIWDIGVGTMRERSARQTGRKIAELVPVQNKVAETGAMIEAGRALLVANFSESAKLAEAGIAPDDETKLRWRRDGTYAAKLAAEAGHGLYRVLGASGMFNTSPLQQPIRDLTAGATHAHVSWEINGPAHGRVALGLETDNKLI
ncbi:MAG: acyl-CoA dehydrogenase family protein [Alphaproteobacteria bacterium]